MPQLVPKTMHLLPWLLRNVPSYKYIPSKVDAHLHAILYVHFNYIYILYVYMLYGIQDPGPYIHITVYPDPCPVPYETTTLFTISSHHVT